MYREEFPMLNLENPIIYFDNGATTLKPESVVLETVDYYTKYTANAHRGDYKNSVIVDEKYEHTRNLVKDFINASSTDEIVFTSGTTDSMNMIIFGFMDTHLNKGDEILITKMEHASNVLGWMELAKRKELKIRYIPLTSDNTIDYDEFSNMINSNTKVVSLAHVTNVIGDVRDVDRIGEVCLKNNIYFVLDAAQSAPHISLDVRKINASFVSFSAHKMLGPTGVGVLYGKKELLNEMNPVRFGGGMNESFDENEVIYSSIPSRFEGGTPNIAGVIAFGRAIELLNKIGMDNIHNYELSLRRYLIDRLKEVDNVEVYNENSNSGIVLFNLKGIFAQDTAIFLDNYNICVRAGNHCAKMTKDELGVKNTCRISLYFYNTKEEIDKLISVLKESDHIFDVVI